MSVNDSLLKKKAEKADPSKAREDDDLNKDAFLDKLNYKEKNNDLNFKIIIKWIIFILAISIVIILIIRYIWFIWHDKNEIFSLLKEIFNFIFGGTTTFLIKNYIEVKK